MTELSVKNNRQFAALRRIWRQSSPEQRLEILNFMQHELQAALIMEVAPDPPLISPAEWPPPAGETSTQLKQKAELSPRTRNAVLRGLARAEPGSELALLRSFDHFLLVLGTEKRLPLRGVGAGGLAELRQVFHQELTDYAQLEGLWTADAGEK